MRAVENPDHSGRWHRLVDTPQEVVSQLVLRWFLKASGDRPDWIYRSEYVANSAVLTARIRTLQDHQQRVPALGIENFLHAVDLGDIGRHRSFGLRSGEGYCFAVPRIDIGELSFPVRRHSVALQGAEIDRWKHLTSEAEPPSARSRSSNGALRCCARFRALPSARVPARLPARRHPSPLLPRHYRRPDSLATMPPTAHRNCRNAPQACKTYRLRQASLPALLGARRGSAARPRRNAWDRDRSAARWSRLLREPRSGATGVGPPQPHLQGAHQLRPRTRCRHFAERASASIASRQSAAPEIPTAGDGGLQIASRPVLRCAQADALRSSGAPVPSPA